jgi:hypothetical protein
LFIFGINKTLHFVKSENKISRLTEITCRDQDQDLDLRDQDQDRDRKICSGDVSRSRAWSRDNITDKEWLVLTNK